ncbi:MAG: hypothetical protein ONB23_05370 [candidate division KSB1 bacterium]|nr:hypothetical protein [candidate division KSB1 bacterium]
MAHAERDDHQEFPGVDRVPIRFHRIARALTVGMTASFGWGVRGIFGHELGAAIPGILIGFALALLSGHPLFRGRRWEAAAAGALGFAIGGSMSYGLLIGYTRHVQMASVVYGYLGLLLVGALWGLLGGAWVGLALARAITVRRLAVAVVAMGAAGGLGYALLVLLLGLHLSPPRSDAWAVVLGAAVALSWLLRRWQVPAGWGGAIFGALGFGLGFVLGNAAQTLGSLSGLPFDWWKVMEMGMGFCGGSALAWGIWLMGDLGRPLLRKPDMRDADLPLAARLIAWGLVFVWVPVGLVATRFSSVELAALAHRAGLPAVGAFVGSRQLWAWTIVAAGVLATVRLPFSSPGSGRSEAAFPALVFALEMLLLAALKSVHGDTQAWAVLGLLAAALLTAILLGAALRGDARVFHLHPPAPTARRVIFLAAIAVLLTLGVALWMRALHASPLPGAQLRWR